MGRFKFPVPQDVLVGNPSLFCESTKVLNLYNQDNPNNVAYRDCPRVRNWFVDTALEVGWSGVAPVGSGGYLLFLKVVIVNDNYINGNNNLMPPM